jgi:hypothetical protein
MALDVAEPAQELRALHRSLGYVDVSTVQWDGKSYRSVVMEKPLDQSPLREHLRTLARYNLWATRELFAHVDTAARRRLPARRGPVLQEHPRHAQPPAAG